MPVWGWGSSDDGLDLSLGNAWLLVEVIILQGPCRFTLLAHFSAARPSRGVYLQKPLPDSPRVDSRVQLFCQAGLVSLPSPSYALPAASAAFPACLSITHLLSSAASHTCLPGLLGPHFLPPFLLTSAFCKPSPTLVSKCLSCFIPGSFPLQELAARPCHKDLLSELLPSQLENAEILLSDHNLRALCWHPAENPPCGGLRHARSRKFTYFRGPGGLAIEQSGLSRVGERPPEAWCAKGTESLVVEAGSNPGRRGKGRGVEASSCLVGRGRWGCCLLCQVVLVQG